MLNEHSAKLVRKSCYKCGYIRATSDQSCADCGKALESVSRIKITGVIQIIFGSILLIFMGWLAFWILNSNSYNHFNGGANDVLFIVFIFGLIVSISLGVMSAGLTMQRAASSYLSSSFPEISDARSGALFV